MALHDIDPLLERIRALVAETQQLEGDGAKELRRGSAARVAQLKSCSQGRQPGQSATTARRPGHRGERVASNDAGGRCRPRHQFDAAARGGRGRRARRGGGAAGDDHAPGRGRGRAAQAPSPPGRARAQRAGRLPPRARGARRRADASPRHQRDPRRRERRGIPRGDRWASFSTRSRARRASSRGAALPASELEPGTLVLDVGGARPS